MDMKAYSYVQSDEAFPYRHDFGGTSNRGMGFEAKVFKRASLVSDRLSQYRKSIRCKDHLEKNPLDPSLKDLLDQSRLIYRSRRDRSSFLDECLFGEPAWDIMLDLLIALLEGRQTSISSCCIASACPTTTGLRWIGKLEKQNLIERIASDSDKRSAYVVLTQKGALGMAQCIANILQGRPSRSK